MWPPNSFLPASWRWVHKTGVTLPQSLGEICVRLDLGTKTSKWQANWENFKHSLFRIEANWSKKSRAFQVFQLRYSMIMKREIDLLKTNEVGRKCGMSKTKCIYLLENVHHFLLQFSLSWYSTSVTIYFRSKTATAT